MANTSDTPKNLGEAYDDGMPTTATGDAVATYAGNGIDGGTDRGMNKITTDLREQADKALGKAKETASAAYDKAAAKARELADMAPDKARELKERAQKVSEEGTAKVRATVQEQPLAALGAGIALGFVVGWLISGRNKD